MWGGIAAVESMLMEEISVLYFPGVPWDLDVVFLSLLYLVIGYLFSEVILFFLCTPERKLDFIILIIAAALAWFVYIDFGGTGEAFYALDMKHIKYSNYFLNILVPSLFFLVLLRGTFWISRLTHFFSRILALLGRITIPIMFLHVPLNELLLNFFDYSWPVYVLVGILGPLVICFCVNGNAYLCQTMGIPRLPEKGRDSYWI